MITMLELYNLIDKLEFDKLDKILIISDNRIKKVVKSYCNNQNNKGVKQTRLMIEILEEIHFERFENFGGYDDFSNFEEFSNLYSNIEEFLSDMIEGLICVIVEREAYIYDNSSIQIENSLFTQKFFKSTF